MKPACITLNRGEYKGRIFSHVRESRPLNGTRYWWVLDDGNYFRSLDALTKHVDTTSKGARK